MRCLKHYFTQINIIVICFVLSIFSHKNSLSAIPQIKIGIEVLATQYPNFVRDKKVALLVSRSSYDQNMRHVIDRISKAAKIQVIFTGDNYFRETIPAQQSNQKLDAIVNAPVIELLDPINRPSVADLNNAQIIVVDIQDIGIRYFNYVTLLAQFLELAREAKIPIYVLDRPNPLGADLVAGPVIDISLRNKYGVYPIPVVYGLTIGELALLFNKLFGIGASLTVIGMEGYTRSMTYRDTGLVWIHPSDHLPEPETPLYYATTGFLGEMGVFSVGVGTTKPFQYILAPWIDGELLSNKLQKMNLAGVKFLPVQVMQYYGLFQQKKIPGVQIIVCDANVYDPVITGISILKALYELYPDKIPLNNSHVANALDSLLGTTYIRNAIVKGIPLFQIQSEINLSLKNYLKIREEFIIYK